MPVRKSLLLLSIVTMISLTVLLGLGFWQLERLSWKEHLISMIDTRINRPPVALGDAVAGESAGEDIRYLRIAADGTFTANQELHLFTVIDRRVGWLVYSPFTTEQGILIVNRGFIGEDTKDPAIRPLDENMAQPDLPITGLARMPENQNMFVPDNDENTNTWYWRDIDAMAAAFNIPPENLLPFYLDLQSPVPESGSPQPSVTRITLTNKHLGYAITWFGLGIVLVVIFLVLARRLAGSAR